MSLEIVSDACPKIYSVTQPWMAGRTVSSAQPLQLGNLSFPLTKVSGLF